MGLASLASKASNVLQKYSPLHRMVGQATSEYIDTGSKKALGKVMAPFVVGAAVPVAMAAGAGTGLSSLAAGVSRIAPRAVAGAKTIPTRLTNLAQKPAIKTAGKIGVGTGAVVGGKVVYDKLTGQQIGTDTGGGVDTGSGINPGAAEPAYGGGGSGSGSGSGGSSSGVLKLIGADWEDAGDEISRIKGDVESYASELDGRLGKLRDSYLSAIDERKRQDDAAIGGQRTLVEKDRDTELYDLADQAQRGFFKQNLRYGTTGGANSSAVGMAQKGIQRMVEKERRSILDQVGVLFAELNQKSEEVRLTAERDRENAYAWEKQMKDEAVQEYNDSIKALKRLNDKKGSWKQKDIEGQTEERLGKLLNNLAEIEIAAKTRRNAIHQSERDIDSAIKDLRMKAALTFAPAELDAEKIDPNSKIEVGANEEDFFNPDQTGKRISKVKNILDELDKEDAADMTGTGEALPA